MKLYEFDYCDNRNQPESDVLASVGRMLEKEAEIQGWAPGYSFRQTKPKKDIGHGEVEFYFVVEGAALRSDNASEPQDKDQNSIPNHEQAASP